MKALLVSENAKLRELLSFQITSLHPLEIKECHSARDAVDILKKPENIYQLLIAPYNGADSVMVKHLRERKDSLPVIFFFDPAILSPEPSSTDGIRCLGMVEQVKIVEGIGAILKEFLKSPGDGEKQDDSEFCPIRTTLLIDASPLKGDIYIKLSAQKFVKLFRNGDEFDSNDLQKYYEEKKVEYLYLKKGETLEFIKKFQIELDALLAKPDITPEETRAASEATQETVQELVHKIGFTEEVQELAKKSVQLTMRLVGSNPKLKDVLDRMMSTGNYLSQHSTLLAEISCCIAKEMEWGSESTFSKLVLASFMHDISIDNPELAKINSMKELAERATEFPEDAVKNYHLHPARSADVVRAFKEIPADVDLIVLQHHEKPNTGGFPRGLAHNYIAPLSALFIISHDLTQNVLEKREKFVLADFVGERKPFYAQGNFKKVMASMEKMKL